MSHQHPDTGTPHTSLRRAIRFVVISNLAYFFVEFTVAWSIGSVALFADSVDFLEDASVNFLILVALGWPLLWRARLGYFLAAMLMVPAVATLWMAWLKFSVSTPPEPLALSLTGLGALAVNTACAFALARHRRESGSLTKAAFYSARNDALANLAIIGAGVVTLFIASAWPDMIVGLGIAIINAGAAREVWLAARAERRQASVEP